MERVAQPFYSFIILTRADQDLTLAEDPREDLMAVLATAAPIEKPHYDHTNPFSFLGQQP